MARLHNVGATVKAAPRLRLDPQTYGRDPLKFLKDGNFVPMELASRFETIVTQICDAITPRFETSSTFCSTEIATRKYFVE
jgi:hypothetical protein